MGRRIDEIRHEALMQVTDRMKDPNVEFRDAILAVILDLNIRIAHDVELLNRKIEALGV